MKCAECGFKVYRGRCASCGFWQLECECGATYAAKRRSKKSCSDKCRVTKFRKHVTVTSLDIKPLSQSANIAGLTVTGTKCKKCGARMCSHHVIHHWTDCEDYDEKSDGLCARILRGMV